MNAKKTLRWVGIGLILIVGFIHAADAPDSFSDAAYKGWLFYANAAAALVSAIGIFRGKRIWGWNLGFVIAAVSFFGYIISRTVGLPYIPAEPDAWLEPLGVASLIAEGSFMAIFIWKSKADK